MLATVADPVLAQSSIDRFTSTVYDLIIKGEFYRRHLRPDQKPGNGAGQNGEG